jgi:hypothetical protein
MAQFLSWAIFVFKNIQPATNKAFYDYRGIFQQGRD